MICRAWFSLFGISSPPILSSSRRCRCPRKYPGGKYRWKLLDAVIENNDELLEKYIAGEPISREKLAREEQQRVQDASPVPSLSWQRQNGLGIQPLMDVTGLFPKRLGNRGAPPSCGSVFKVEYTDCGQRRVYLRLYSGTLVPAGYGGPGRERKKLKITEMRIPSKRGNCSDRHRLSG